MPGFRLYDRENGEELLPSEDPGFSGGFGYTSIEKVFQAAARVYDDPEKVYDEEVAIQELERIGWIDLEKLPSRREIIADLQDNPFQELEDEVEDW